MNDDLIRRRDALEALNKQKPLDKSVMRRVVVQVPSVDAVEVVRCKDCKNFGRTLENDTYCRCVGGLTDPEENDFCRYGERRKDDDI